MNEPALAELYIKVLLDSRTTAALPTLMAYRAKYKFSPVARLIDENLYKYGDTVIPFLKRFLLKMEEDSSYLPLAINAKPSRYWVENVIFAHYLIRTRDLMEFLLKYNTKLKDRWKGLKTKIETILATIVDDAFDHPDIESFVKVLDDNNNVSFQHCLRMIEHFENNSMFQSYALVTQEAFFLRNDHVIHLKDMPVILDIFYADSRFKVSGGVAPVFEPALELYEELVMSRYLSWDRNYANLDTEFYVFGDGERRGKIWMVFEKIYTNFVRFFVIPILIMIFYFLRPRLWREIAFLLRKHWPYEEKEKNELLTRLEDHIAAVEAFLFGHSPHFKSLDPYLEIQFSRQSTKFIKTLTIAKRITDLKAGIFACYDFFVFLEILIKLGSKNSIFLLLDVYDDTTIFPKVQYKDIYLSLAVGQVLRNELLEYELGNELWRITSTDDVSQAGYTWYSRDERLTSGFFQFHKRLILDVEKAIDILYVDRALIRYSQLLDAISAISVKILFPALVNHFKKHYSEDDLGQLFYERLFEKLGFNTRLLGRSLPVFTSM